MKSQRWFPCASVFLAFPCQNYRRFLAERLHKISRRLKRMASRPVEGSMQCLGQIPYRRAIKSRQSFAVNQTFPASAPSAHLVLRGFWIPVTFAPRPLSGVITDNSLVTCVDSFIV